jgi:glycosyltransferase involved in cell wall biosynthesis
MKMPINGELFPISAIVPIRNGMEYLPDFLEKNDELLSSMDEVIFVNDNSSDGTLIYLQTTYRGKNHIQVIDNQLPGLVNALNLGISSSRNLWIARFDVDDIYSTSRIESQYKLVGSDVGVIFSDYETVDQFSNPLGLITSPVTSNLTLLSLVNSRRTAHPSALINKQAFYEVGGYKNEEHPVEDLGLWLRIAASGFQLLSVPEILLTYRIHHSSISSTKQFEMRKRKSELICQYDFYPIFQSALKNWKCDISAVSKTTHSSQRKFLSCVDFFAVSKRLSHKQLLESFFHFGHVFVTLLDIAVVRAGFMYYLNGSKRRKMREL